jgi:flagella basal body P-ring formation protein FlgA
MTKFQRQQTKQSILYMFRLTFKSMTIALAITYGLLFAMATINSAEANTLKPEAIIHDKVVKVSDIFTDIPLKKDAVIGNAPSPGQSVILSARTLDRIAHVYNLDWKSTGPADQIIVKASVNTVTTDMIREAIKADLKKQGVEGEFDVNLNNLNPTMALAGNTAATVEVTQLSYVAGRDVFTAVLAAPNAANPVQSISVTGLIEKTIQIPVLESSISMGDVISSSDIKWMNVASRHMVHDTILDADNLIGKTPVRMVEANVPIRARDVKAPQVISRGDEILLQFNQGGLTLTAKGKAMQNGAAGEVIRVINLSSNQSLRAEVTGHKIVTVQ